MINTERLQMEISDILNDYTGEQLEVLMAENGLNSNDTYNPESNTNKKNILKTALSILEAIANNPQLMKNYKTEDMTITGFSENLQNRIDALDRKIRLIANDDNVYEQGASFAYLFKE